MTTDTEILNDPRHLATLTNPSDQFVLLIQMLGRLQESHYALEEKLVAHMREETGELAKAVRDLMREAFPEGDPDGHRRHHELVIRKEEKRAEFWESMVRELTKWGLVGFLGWAAYALWQAFIQGPSR